MYVPRPFAVEDRGELLAFIEREPFGMLISAAGGAPAGTHAPFVILSADPLVLGVHVAKANPQWREIDGTDVLAVFQGAHAMISASWYEQPREHVPTWNYSAVHCTGRARVTDDEGTARIVERLVERFEPSWRAESADAAYISRLRRAIVGIEIAVRSLEGARKFSQNHPETDRRRLIAGLEASPRAMDREVAAGMSATLR